MVSTEELEEAIQTNNSSRLRTSYTKGYASLEQKTGKLRQLGKHSDIYSLGAVLFYAMWHKTPSAFDCDPAAVYDYILDRLVEIDQFSVAEKHLLKILSVFDQPGIKASLLRELTALPNLDMITRLEECGWFLAQ